MVPCASFPDQRMTSRLRLAHGRLRLCVALGLLALVVAALLRHEGTAHAQASDQLTIYSPQTTYSIPLITADEQPYVGLVDALEPLGSIDARPDGKKYKLRFTPPGGRAVEAQFNEEKNKAKILGENYKLSANFFIQNG